MLDNDFDHAATPEEPVLFDPLPPQPSQFVGPEPVTTTPLSTSSAPDQSPRPPRPPRGGRMASVVAASLLSAVLAAGGTAALVTGPLAGSTATAQRRPRRPRPPSRPATGDRQLVGDRE